MSQQKNLISLNLEEMSKKMDEIVNQDNPNKEELKQTWAEIKKITQNMVEKSIDDEKEKESLKQTIVELKKAVEIKPIEQIEKEYIDGLKKSKFWERARKAIEDIQPDKKYTAELIFTPEGKLDTKKIEIRTHESQYRHVTPIALVGRIFDNAIHAGDSIDKIFNKLSLKIEIFKPFFTEEDNLYIQSVFDFFKNPGYRTSSGLSTLIKIIIHFYNTNESLNFTDKYIEIPKIHNCYLIVPPASGNEGNLNIHDSEGTFIDVLCKNLDKMEEKIANCELSKFLDKNDIEYLSQLNLQKEPKLRKQLGLEEENEFFSKFQEEIRKPKPGSFDLDTLKILKDDFLEPLKDKEGAKIIIDKLDKMIKNQTPTQVEKNQIIYTIFALFDYLPLPKGAKNPEEKKLNEEIDRYKGEPVNRLVKVSVFHLNLFFEAYPNLAILFKKDIVDRFLRYVSYGVDKGDLFKLFEKKITSYGELFGSLTKKTQKKLEERIQKNETLDDYLSKHFTNEGVVCGFADQYPSACTVYLLKDSLPSYLLLSNYKNNYIFIENNRDFMYIPFEGEPEKIKINKESKAYLKLSKSKSKSLCLKDEEISELMVKRDIFNLNIVTHNPKDRFFNLLSSEVKKVLIKYNLDTDNFLTIKNIEKPENDPLDYKSESTDLKYNFDDSVIEFLFIKLKNNGNFENITFPMKEQLSDLVDIKKFNDFFKNQVKQLTQSYQSYPSSRSSTIKKEDLINTTNISILDTDYNKAFYREISKILKGSDHGKKIIRDSIKYAYEEAKKNFIATDTMHDKLKQEIRSLNNPIPGHPQGFESSNDDSLFSPTHVPKSPPVAKIQKQPPSSRKFTSALSGELSPLKENKLQNLSDVSFDSTTESNTPSPAKVETKSLIPNEPKTLSQLPPKPVTKISPPQISNTGQFPLSKPNFVQEKIKGIEKKREQAQEKSKKNLPPTSVSSSFDSPAKIVQSLSQSKSPSTESKSTSLSESYYSSGAPSPKQAMDFWKKSDAKLVIDEQQKKNPSQPNKYNLRSKADKRQLPKYDPDNLSNQLIRKPPTKK